MLWGTMAVTSDPHYTYFVSPNEEDTELGAISFRQTLMTIGTGSLILLDEFPEEQQWQILRRLEETADTGDRWMVISAFSRCNHAKGRKWQTQLRKTCNRLVEILPGQHLRAKKDAWQTGDITPTKTDTSYTVWVGKGYKVTLEDWEYCIQDAVMSTQELTELSEAGVDYWRAR